MTTKYEFIYENNSRIVALTFHMRTKQKVHESKTKLGNSSIYKKKKIYIYIYIYIFDVNSFYYSPRRSVGVGASARR